MPKTAKLTRRRFLAATTASTAMVAMPYVRGAHAAGKLTIGLWDHWVPGANTTSTRLIEDWAAKEEGPGPDPFHPDPGQQAAPDGTGRGARQDGPRHHALPLLGSGRSRQAARACR